MTPSFLENGWLEGSVGFRPPCPALSLPPAILICKNNKLSFVYQPADGHNKERRPEESTEKSLSLSLSLSSLSVNWLICFPASKKRGGVVMN